MASVTVEFEDGTERTFPHASSVQDSVENGIVSVYTYDHSTCRYTVESMPMTDVFGWRNEPVP